MTTTATCLCGTVQLAFSLEGDNLVDTFVCNCSDCRKITASMFASNFIIKDDTLKHVRGEDKLTRYLKTEGILSGHTMASHFCSVCGTLMYRISSGLPGKLVTRIGTVDDFKLHETVLKPRVEQFVKDRVAWFKGAEGAQQEQGNYFV